MALGKDQGFGGLPLVGAGSCYGLHPHHSVRQPQGGFEGVGQASGNAFLDHQPVNDDLKRVFFALLQSRRLGKFVEFAIDADANEACRTKLRQFFVKIPLLVPHNRGQKHQAGFFRQIQDAINHLLDSARGDFAAALRTVNRPGTRIQQPQVIVDFGDCADGGAWVRRA